MRRHLTEPPVSRAASWSRRVAGFAWLTVAVALVLARLNRLLPYQTLAVLAACAVLATAAILLAAFAFAVIWRDGRPGFGAAVGGLVLALALLAYPAARCLADLVEPAPLDITTDPDDPPRSPDPSVAQPRTDPVAASATAAGVPTAIQPAVLDMSIEDALAMALRVAGQMSWHVTKVAYPREPERDEASFAALVPSLVVRWPSDAVVRLLATDEGVRVDVRLTARQPWSLLRAGNGAVAAYLDRLAAPVTGKTPHAGR
jgi:hypothetical protein